LTVYESTFLQTSYTIPATFNENELSPDIVVPLDVHLLEPLPGGFLTGVSHSKHDVAFYLEG
jgi:hypothetical protein